MIEQHLRILIFIISLSTIITVNGRCYLCSQDTLAECAGSNQLDSSIYTNVLQYYTEPCNGQCVLFRSENHSIVRGCSWTYGHMTFKSIGWHEISPGIKAYFCNSHLCNNGTYEQPERKMINNQLILLPPKLFLLAGNNPSLIQTGEYLSRQLYQCYSCTARFEGCGEFLDPQHAAYYIRPCSTSCIIFRNPNDLNLLTRDCSTFWPQIRVKSGLHKLLGSDAFFCQESLCNGISFDFIMGIFYNQLPAAITFPKTEAISITTTTTTSRKTTTTSRTTTTTSRTTTSALRATTTTSRTTTATSRTTTATSRTTTSASRATTTSALRATTTTTSRTTTTSPSRTTTATSRTTINIYNDDSIWDDPDLDYVLNEPTTSTISNNSTTTSSMTIDHLDITDEMLSSSTIVGGLATAQSNFSLNWWDLNDSSISLASLPTTLISSTAQIEENDDWIISNTSSIPSITRFEHLSVDDDIENNNEDEYILSPLLKTTSIANLNNNRNTTQPSISYDLPDNRTIDELLEYMKPLSTLVIPPFSWMLNMAIQNKSKHLNSTTTIQRQTTQLITTTSQTSGIFYEYCKNKQCQHDGRLNSDCLCICLPAFTGDNCETVVCEQEPADICAFVLEHECAIDHIRYLCPQFCQMNHCSSEKM